MNFTTILQTYLNNDKLASSVGLSGMKNITFSVGMFSLHDPATTKMQFHHTSAEIANAANGTQKVDGDSIYRMASVTKLFTAFAGLLELKSTDWDRPLTDILPTLANSARKTPGAPDPVYTVEWDKITPNALAAQIAGVPRDGFPNQNDFLFQETIGGGLGGIAPGFKSTLLGLPPLNQSDSIAFEPCAIEGLRGNTCLAASWVEGVEARAPSFLPWTTPTYANNGFALLGLVIATITRKPIETVYRESIFTPLGMNSSYASTPPASEWYRSVIPGDPAKTFAIDAQYYVASGGLLTSTGDLSKLGIAILNSTLLPPDQTRKWMKPLSHTANLHYSVGRPWEIIRYTHPSGAITDLYTKLGDSGAYSGYIILLPDYGIGFSILAAASSGNRFGVVTAIADMITDSIMPSLADQAAHEAEHNFGGVYTSAVQGLNSSLTLSVNHTKGASPGLVISSWISNGTNVLTTLAPAIGPLPYRLLPSISDVKGGKIAFRLVTSYDAPSVQPPNRLFSGPSIIGGDWIDVDALAYGGIGFTLFVFDVNMDGKATAVSPAALRIKLQKTT
jgi:CubicO group peptidase (beta-lactamase class C family)